MVAGISSCTSKKETTSSKEANKGPKNVILLIGDGMGLSQVSSAFFFKDSISNFQRFKSIGLINTASSRQKITDSASGATAFSTGEKTYNGAIGVSDDTVNLPTIVEQLSEHNWATGVISTSSITHATPASFFAHVPQRSMQEEIAVDLTKSPIDYFAGGGLKFFNKRKDGRNLLVDLKQSGFVVDSVLRTPGTTQKAGFLLAENAMPRMLDGRGSFLQQASLDAISFLESKSNNYFLMVEGSQIDWGGHENNAQYLITELLDFDNTIGAILDRIDPEETLVVVTADHETGGFTLSAAIRNTEDRAYADYNEIGPTFSTGGHSATLIPVFAYGKGAELFSGVYENNEIYHKIMDAIKN